MTKEAIPDFSNPFAEMESQFEANENRNQEKPIIENKEEAEELPDVGSDDESERLDNWENPQTEEQIERNHPNKRISKLVHQLNRLHEKVSLQEQEKESYLAELSEKERLIREKDELLLTSYKNNLEKDRNELEKLYDLAIEEGDREARIKINTSLRKIDSELIKLDTVLDSNNAQYNNDRRNTQVNINQKLPNYQQFNNQSNQAQASNQFLEEFAARNPEFLTDARMARRAYNIDAMLAEKYTQQGNAHLIASPSYMKELEAAYRVGFNRPSSNSQNNGENKPRLSDGQKFNAMEVFGIDSATGRRRSQAEAEKLYIDSIKSIRR